MFTREEKGGSSFLTSRIGIKFDHPKWVKQMLIFLLGYFLISEKDIYNSTKMKQKSKLCAVLAPDKQFIFNKNK